MICPPLKNPQVLADFNSSVQKLGGKSLSDDDVRYRERYLKGLSTAQTEAYHTAYALWDTHSGDISRINAFIDLYNKTRSVKPRARTEAEARAKSPVSTALPQSGGRSIRLSDLFHRRSATTTTPLAGGGQMAVTIYESLSGAMTRNVEAGWDKFKNLAIRNLSQLRRESPEAYEKAIKAGGARGQGTVLLQMAVNKIERSLEGSDITWPMVRAALVESRLRGIRERYLDMSHMVQHSTDGEIEDGLENGMLDVLKHIEGKAGMDDTLSDRAVALVQLKDYDGLREFLAAVFDDVADRVGRVNMGPRADAFDLLVSQPPFQKALRQYKQLIERPIAESHASNEGIFSDALGPLNTYYPLIAVKEDGGIIQRIFGSARFPYRKPKNIANHFATGLASHGYSLEISDFKDRIQAAVRTNNKADLLSELDRQGLVKVLGRKEQAQDTMEIDGETVPARTVDVGSDLLVIRNGESTRIQGARAVVPQWLHSELKPILEKEPPREPGTGEGLVNHVIEASLIGPLDLAFHGTNVLGTLVGNTPFVNKSLLGKTIFNLPPTKFITAIVETARTDPMTEESIKDLTEMSKLGLIPPRFGSVTYSKKYAESTGAKQKLFSAGPLLYGPRGLDVRARLVMWRIAKLDPSMTPAQRFDFVSQLGIYNKELESQIERWAKSTHLAPFATAGLTMLRNGINTWTGAGPVPAGGKARRAAYRIAALLSGGAAGLLAMWALLYKEYKGKYPWQDPEARLLQIPLNEEDRNSKWGKKLFGDDPTKTAYVNLSFFSPLVSRGSRALGISGAFQARQLGGTPGQQFEYAQRDIYNSLAHPFVSGPLVRAPFVFLTGNEPQISSLRDVTGRFGPELYPAIKKAPPGWPTLEQRGAEAVANVNPFAQTVAAGFGFGEKGQEANQEGKPSRWVRMVADLVAPRLLGSSVDVLSQESRIAKQAKAAGGKPSPDVKLPEDVRVLLHRHGILPAKPPRKPGESDDDYKVRVDSENREIATRVKAMTDSDAFKKESPDDQKATLQSIIKRSRQAASTTYQREYRGERDVRIGAEEMADQARIRLSSRPEWSGLSKEQQKAAMSEVSRFFGKLSVPKKVEKLPDDARRALTEGQRQSQKSLSPEMVDSMLDAILRRVKAAA